MATQLQTERGIVRVPTGTWRIDPAHSSVEFQVKHMMIATVRGRDDRGRPRHQRFTRVRDSESGEHRHERADSRRAPALARFLGRGALPGNSIRVETDRATRRPELPHHGRPDDQRRDSRGRVRSDGRGGRAGSVGQRARRDQGAGTIDRTEFGLRWQKVLETGGFLVGEEVEIVVDISAVRES
jgi:hypothetical protein